MDIVPAVQKVQALNTKNDNHLNTGVFPTYTYNRCLHFNTDRKHMLLLRSLIMKLYNIERVCQHNHDKNGFFCETYALMKIL